MLSVLVVIPPSGPDGEVGRVVITLFGLVSTERVHDCFRIPETNEFGFVFATQTPSSLTVGVSTYLEGGDRFQRSKGDLDFLGGVLLDWAPVAPLIANNKSRSLETVAFQRGTIVSVRIPIRMCRPAIAGKTLRLSTAGGRRDIPLRCRTYSTHVHRYRTSGRPCAGTSRTMGIEYEVPKVRDSFPPQSRDLNLHRIPHYSSHNPKFSLRK